MVDEDTALLSRCDDAASPAAEVCCHPRSRKQRDLQGALNRCYRPPGLTPPVPRNSPVLLEYLKEKVHGGEDDAAAAAATQRTGIAALPAAARRAVYVVYAMAFLSMALMTTVTPTLLLYLRHAGLAGRYDLQFYVTVSVIGTSVPVVMHALLSRLADMYGAPRSLSLACLAVALGLLGMAAFDDSRHLFAASYLSYSVAQSLRPVRTIILSDLSTDESRTEVMSLHALMTPLGAMVGPLIWLAVQNYKGDWLLLGTLRVNMYTIDYFIAASLALCMGAVAAFLLPADTSSGVGDQSSSTSSGDVIDQAIAPQAVLYDERGEEVIHVHLQNVSCLRPITYNSLAPPPLCMPRRTYNSGLFITVGGEVQPSLELTRVCRSSLRISCFCLPLLGLTCLIHARGKILRFIPLCIAAGFSCSSAPSCSAATQAWVREQRDRGPSALVAQPHDS